MLLKNFRSITLLGLLSWPWLSIQGGTIALSETMTWRGWWILLVGFVATMALNGCALYNERQDVRASTSTDKYELKVVQADDFGTLWNVEDANNALDTVKASAKETNTLVVVFIHGWHHNASPDDENLTGFKKRLEALHAQLSTPNRRALRKQLTHDPDFRLIGVYVGWRGRSLPGFLDYATAWWRKSAAERVGEGDIAEFIERLQRQYLRANAYVRTAKNGDHVYKPFMGLITIGHSFGGQVLLKSVGRTLEYELAERADRFSDILNPGSAQITNPVYRPMDDLGDLNILLNPAVEAYQYARIDALYRQLTYPTQQTPQLIVFSADDDSGRKIAFPIQRALTRPFKPGFRSDNNDFQSELWGQALGVLEKQITHTLIRAPGELNSLVDTDYVQDEGAKIRDFDFSGPTVFEEIKLVPSSMENTKTAPRILNSPVAVVQVKQDIIVNHNGIFEDDFNNFLASYVAFIEGKRLLLRHSRLTESHLREERKVAK